MMKHDCPSTKTNIQYQSITQISNCVRHRKGYISSSLEKVSGIWFRNNSYMCQTVRVKKLVKSVKTHTFSSNQVKTTKSKVIYWSKEISTSNLFSIFPIIRFIYTRISKSHWSQYQQENNLHSIKLFTHHCAILW